MAAPTKTPWSSVRRSASQTRWQSVTLQSNTVTSKVSYRTNSFVEIGTGLNVTNAQGQFVSANPSFTITPTGAEARGAAHQVIVPGDIGSGAGVRVVMPGGEELVFQPLAIDYFDPVDGQGVLLDVVTNAVGWLVASNEIVFSNCFVQIKASIRLRNTRAGLESDLILHESPPEPSVFGLSSSARLEMLTEQLAGPTPSQRFSLLQPERDPVIAAAMLEPDLVDTELTYGTMKMGAGRAFITPATTNVPPAARSSRVAKSFLEFDNRKIVIEAVEHRRVRPALLLLPPATNAVRQAGLAPLRKAERLAKNTRRLPPLTTPGETREAALRNKKSLPVQQAWLTEPNASAALGGTGYQPVPPGYQPGGTKGRADEPSELLGAGALPSVPSGGSPLGTGRLPVLPTEPLASAPAPAFVLDYYLVNIYGENDFTFRSDETYWVSEPIALSGTTTIEGGAVIKFSEATGLYFFEEDALICDTTEHLPAVFTSYDDNSVGENVGGNGNPELIGTWGLYFISGGSRALSNVRFTYLSNPIAMEGGGTANDLTLRNVQVRKSDYVVDSGTTDISIYNGLFVDSGMLFSYADTFVGEHLTLHNATVLGSGASTATVKNSLLVQVANAPSGFGTYTETSMTNLASATGVFQTVEGGDHYLTNGTYRNAGTTNIDVTLRAALTNLTTHAPEMLTGTLATNRTLTSRTIRDTDAPDLGYHYPAVDYLAKTVSVENATLSMLNGVVVAGGFDSNSLWTPALQLNPGKLLSLGSPARLNRLLRANQVQENVQERGYTLLQDGQEGTFKPEITLRFTELSSLADEMNLLEIAQATARFESSHSAFRNGRHLPLTLYGGSEQTVGLTNNLFHSTHVLLTGNSYANFGAVNNLFKDGAFTLAGGNSSWTFSDNIFDRTALTNDASTVTTASNAYVAVAAPFTFDTAPVVLTNLAYATGPLGRYYLADATLVNGGSRDADEASLYHFTTTTNQVKETNSTVDIGLHYVAALTNLVNGTVALVDTDGDDVPDYREDTNGNGAYEAGDLASFNNWDTDNDGMWDGQEVQRGTSPQSAECPRDVYEGVLAAQSPSHWFKLNNGSLTNAISGQPVTTLTNGGGTWDADAFATGSNAFAFNVNTQRLVVGDVISGGTGTNQGSLSLLFRSLNGYPNNTPRYVFCQKGNTTNEFSVFFEATNAVVDPGSWKVQIGGQTNTILLSNAVVFQAWYYLSLTWNESNDVATWYLAPVGGTLTSNTISLGSSSVVGNSTNLNLGNRDGQNRAISSPGIGALDQVAFWNHALPGPEVNAQFDTLNALFQGPSKVFDLTRWELTLPVDNANNLDNTRLPLDISMAGLNVGFKYVDPNACTKKYFYRDATTMVFEVPWNGADQDTNSPPVLGSPRSELRGTLANGNEDNWQPLGTNILEGTCTVNATNLGSGKVIIGQVHGKTPYSVASIVVNYNFPSAGDVSVTFKDRADGTDGPDNDQPPQSDRNIPLATGVPLGATIRYKVELVGTSTSLVLNVTYNGGTTETRTMYQSGDTNWNDSAWLTSYFYFKAGCYFPKAPTNSSARVTFSSLTATHIQ